MADENVLTLGRRRFPVTEATFRRITDDGNGRPGWEFNVRTGPPLRPPRNHTERYMFANGVRLYAEAGDPIPLPDKKDLTGERLVLKEPYDPESGGVYFTLYVCEHDDVSDLTLRFLQRRGNEYRIRVSALAHHVFPEPVKLTIKTWIKRLPAKKYRGDT
jgi:hypothetical protein